MRILFCSLFTLLFSASAMAGEIVGSAFKYDQWVGGAYADDATGEFIHCSIYALFKGGDRLYFFIGRDKTITVAIANAGFRLVKGDRFPVMLTVDRRAPFRGQAVVLSHDLAMLRIFDFDRALTAFKKGFVLIVDSGNRQGRYDLKGTYRALKITEQCTEDYLAYKEAPSVTVEAKTTSTEVDKTLLYQIATGMIAEIGVRDFQFWTDEQVAELDLGEAVFWNAPSANMIGGVYVRPLVNNNELRDSDAADIRDMNEPCEGDVLSGGRKVETDDLPTRELRSICSTDDLIQETIVSKTLLDNVVIYTVMIFSDLKTPTEEVERDRRQMSEDVISRAASFLVPSE